MFTLCHFWFAMCSLLTTRASILNDLQEAQKFVNQLDYDYSAVAADAAAAMQQRPVADLQLWYDYGGGSGGGGGGNSGGGIGYYGSAGPGAATAVMTAGGEKRGGATQASAGGIWFGPRLGRRKRRGGGAAQPADGDAAAGQAVPQDVTAAGQAVVSELINNAPWLLVPIIENSLMQLKQNARNGRSSSEDGDDESFSASKLHSARSPQYSPPYSPPFLPRLGRQASMARPQVPRLGREASTYKRAVAAALLPRRRRQEERRQAAAPPVATESSVAAAAARRH